MARSNQKPRRIVVAPPPGATHWALTAITYTTGRKADGSGKKYSNAVQVPCKGEAGDDGIAPEVWPVAEFSPRRVLQQWGAGRYRVDWYGSDNKKISADTFQVDLPASAKVPAPEPRAARPRDDVDYGSPRHASSYADPTLPTTQAGWAMYMREREDAERERRRQEARDEENRREAAFERQRAADREHTQSLIAALTAGRGAAPPAVDSELIRREMAVTVREQMSGFRAEVGATLQRLQVDSAARGGRDNDRDDPEDLVGGAERIGIRLLGELEDAAPELVEACIPGFIALLQGRGWKPSPEMIEALEGLKSKRNGAGHDA